MNFLIAIFILSACIQLSFWIGFILAYSRIHHQSGSIAFRQEPISIIICAKNEEAHIESLLQALKNQDYPQDLTEIILVNDASSDRTGNICEEWAAAHKNIHCIHIQTDENRHLPGKKYALSKGVQAASGNWVLLTDADCVPRSKNWINEMLATLHHQEADIVLGYGAYQVNPTSKSFLQSFIQFETLHTAIQYFTYAIYKIPYMGVGRNLMYRKELLQESFQDLRLIKKMQKTSSGDDDLIVSHWSGLKNIIVQANPNAATESLSPSSFKAYFKQKSRHASTSKYYPRLIQLCLGAYALSHFIFYILGIILLLFSPGLKYIVLALLLTGILLKSIGYRLWKKQLQTPSHLLTLLFLDFLWGFYNVILSPYIFWKNQQKWN